jgi:hypothetical protein
VPTALGILFATVPSPYGRANVWRAYGAWAMDLCGRSLPTGVGIEDPLRGRRSRSRAEEKAGRSGRDDSGGRSGPLCRSPSRLRIN